MAGEIKGNLLAIIEAGGYPDFTPLYQQAGLKVSSTNTMRRALAISKKLRPDVVVAEFHFGPTYGTRISNLETLFAGLQRDNPEAKLIVFMDRQDQPHLQKIAAIFPVFETLTYPIDRDYLKETIQRAAVSIGSQDR